MLDRALKFLCDEVNTFLQRRLNSSFGRLELGPLVDDKGNSVVSKDSLRLTLFLVEEERHARAQLPEQVVVDGRSVTLPPPLAVNLVVLASASFSTYTEGLRLLALLLTFFQARPVFTPADDPGLPQGLERVAVDLLNYGPEQANQLWACLGAKHLPHAVYRVRLLFLQDREPTAAGAPITQIRTRAGGR